MYMFQHLLVSELMCDCERQRKASVFINTAAAVRLTHASHMRQSQCLTGLIDGGTNVFPASQKTCIILYMQSNVKLVRVRPDVPSDQDSHIMMDWMIVILHVNAFLPLTEAVQAVVCMMGDFQIILIINDSIEYIKKSCIYIYVQYLSMK